MKQIKFRAWDLEHNEWVREDSMPVLSSNNKIWKFGDTDSVKFMQYTGLKDKNGKEIYEGDIIKHHFNNDDKYSLTKVVFGRSYDERGELHESIGFHRVDLNASTFESVQSLTYGLDSFKVVGNIYENNDLL